VNRVVITGFGIVSSIGNGRKEVLDSLKQGLSGIKFHQEYATLGFRSHVHGGVCIDLVELVPRKIKRFMGDASAFLYVAMREAIAHANLSDGMVSHPRSGLITGSGGGSPSNQITAADILRNRGLRKIGPYMVTRSMSSTTSACLSTAFKIKGLSYSISSACSTSAHCIGNAYEQIKIGNQDIVFAGGSEEIHWSTTMLFDAMGALSSKYNDEPKKASRPYDVARDGFVISGGGGIVVLEELSHAQKRGAKIYGELIGYGATSDGFDMVQPSGVGAVRCMEQALRTVNHPIDYINAHGTSTLVGDLSELTAIKQVFSEKVPPISATKSLTGHALGAAGVNEVIYSLLMMEKSFIAPSINIHELDPAAEGFPIVRQVQKKTPLRTVMSNSFGFGGTNASLVFQKI